MTMIAALCMSYAFAGNMPGKKYDKHQHKKVMKFRQDHPDRPGRPERPTPAQMTEKMKMQLHLSDKQVKKVAALNEKYADVLGGPGMGHRHGPKGGKPGMRHDSKDSKPGMHHGDCDNCQKNMTPPQHIDGQTGATGQPRPPKMHHGDHHDKMKAHHEKRHEYEKKLKKILDDSQYEEYKNWGRH